MYEFTLSAWWLGVASVALIWIGYCFGVCRAKAATKQQIGTIDNCVQVAIDQMMTKAKRTDTIDVSKLSCYTAIVGKNSVVLVDMDKQV